MSLPGGLLIGWVGDDFTGSAATMEAMAFSGLPAVLFTDVPTPDQRARFADVRGLGIATTARAHGPGWMEAHLPQAFHYLTTQTAPLVHYKTCSTLDSAPHVGSIGRAIDVALSVVPSAYVPFLVAAPVMRRYQAFGHLFASAPGGVFRLDRHPVMARHPVTPMEEADVARHLSLQTLLPCTNLDVEALDSAPEATLQERAQNGGIVTLDAMTEAHMRKNGRLIWEGRATAPLVAGSQGIEYALIAHWQAQGLIPTQTLSQGAGAVDRIVAVSGSVSPITARQIAWAEGNGFAVIPLDVAAMLGGDVTAEAATTKTARAALDAAQDALIVTARGPDDPAVAQVRAAIKASGMTGEQANTQIGAALGRILKRVLTETGLTRAIVSGGDTSGAVTRQLGLYAFTALAPTTPGAGLLTGYSNDARFDGLQIALKGGQMGSDDYFGWIKRGGGAAGGKQ
ncbi:four-carbon acid sugar kinase family protein [Pseudoprimorskyibacter insulae]|uniref:3-oxo-tetronate kinase n=1 Tax=Pseudoprimorskyibacter insulae TaxID=1695997 RepID=A0A2R8AW15_9RHOB|nr:four-carbon acid sugar kinase family protein [Pseudoprimorskyibacter insulae]SPF80232.1 hypothetical protein PRI8871_02038 [Pseudoprimorskyibacter insulae]